MTRMSTSPASSARRVTAAASPTSAATKRARPPSAEIASTTFLPRSASRPWTTTSAPSRARRSAIARPIPEVAPVTSAVWPTRLLRLLLLTDDMATPLPLVDVGNCVPPTLLADASAHITCSCDISAARVQASPAQPVLALCRSGPRGRRRPRRRAADPSHRACRESATGRRPAVCSRRRSRSAECRR